MMPPRHAEPRRAAAATGRARAPRAGTRQGEPEAREAGLFAQILAVIARVPRGRVVSYGQVARMAGRPGAARMVGWALHAVPSGDSVPWQRVINSGGGISPRGGEAALQRRLLEAEGVRFDARGRVDLARYGWDGRPASRRRARRSD